MLDLSLKATRRLLERYGFAWICFLCLVGISSAVPPLVLPHELHLRIARIFYGDYTPQLDRLAELTVTNFTHRFFGTIYFVIAPLQFVRSLRGRLPTLHRWCGRLFLVVMVIVTVGGVVFALRASFVGMASALPSLLLAPYIFFSGYRAYTTARVRRFAEHREWMIRCFAGGLSIATIRLWFLLLRFTTDWSIEVVVASTFWLGPLTNLLCAEQWIRWTAPRPRLRGRPAGGSVAGG